MSACADPRRRAKVAKFAVRQKQNRRGSHHARRQGHRAGGAPGLDRRLGHRQRPRRSRRARAGARNRVRLELPPNGASRGLPGLRRTTTGRSGLGRRKTPGALKHPMHRRMSNWRRWWRRMVGAACRRLAAVYRSTKPGWQLIVVPRATVILEGSKQPGRPLQPTNFELSAGRASSLTTVPTG